MKVDQKSAMSPGLLEEARKIGDKLARLRIARNIKQEEAAIRSGLSRNTVYRLEKGDPGVAFGQILRYIDAIAPGVDIQHVLTEKDPALIALQVKERKHRVRDIRKAELEEIDF